MIIGTAGCGLRYAVKQSGNAVGYCSLTIRCGTRDEGGFHSGIAHFTEHALFKGTERKSAKVISSYLDKLGGELNAFTTKEEIVIHSTVLKEDIGKAAALLLELATCPTFPEDEVAIEKGVVIDEINSSKILLLTMSTTNSRKLCSPGILSDVRFSARRPASRRSQAKS